MTEDKGRRRLLAAAAAAVPAMMADLSPGAASAATEPTSVNRHKQIMRRWFEEGWGGNLGLADEIFDSTFTLSGKAAGPGGPKANVARTRAGFADIAVVIEQQVAEGDWVVTRYTARGTHTGEFSGVPATQRKIIVPGIVMWRFVGDKAVEDWTMFDFPGLMRQIS